MRCCSAAEPQQAESSCMRVVSLLTWTYTRSGCRALIKGGSYAASCTPAGTGYKTDGKRPPPPPPPPRALPITVLMAICH